MDKVKSIFCHVLTSLKSDCEESDLKESPSIDSDILIDMFYKQQELWSATGDEEDIQSEELVTARSGRVIRPWRNCNSPAYSIWGNE